MIDLHMTDDGDFSPSTNGDIATTSSAKEQIRQQCLLRLATERGDFVVYPDLGADLQRLVGLPNSPRTASLGVKLIQRALSHDGFIDSNLKSMSATPTNVDTIRFKVSIPYGDKTYLNLTLEQLLKL
jgi:hypothetical protein